jgi:hypothetical protein
VKLDSILGLFLISILATYYSALPNSKYGTNDMDEICLIPGYTNKRQFIEE